MCVWNVLRFLWSIYPNIGTSWPKQGELSALATFCQQPAALPKSGFLRSLAATEQVERWSLIHRDEQWSWPKVHRFFSRDLFFGTLFGLLQILPNMEHFTTRNLGRFFKSVPCGWPHHRWWEISNNWFISNLATAIIRIFGGLVAIFYFPINIGLLIIPIDVHIPPTRLWFLVTEHDTTIYKNINWRWDRGVQYFNTHRGSTCLDCHGHPWPYHWMSFKDDVPPMVRSSQFPVKIFPQTDPKNTEFTTQCGHPLNHHE